MKQSRLMSWLESCINIAVGFGISLAAQMFFLPLLGVAIDFHQNLFFALIMTVISLLRSFLLRRVFETLHIRRPLSAFMQAVIAECYRQREVEGYDAAHDAQHSPRELARAGAAYLLGGEETKVGGNGVLPQRFTGFLLWPWNRESWKPRELRRDLVRGCALGIAAGELADRNRKK
jgi:hypothetical protein